MMARGDLDRYNDPTQIHVLSLMGVQEFLDRAQIEDFHAIEEAALYADLSWYVKLFRFFTGAKKLKPQEIKAIKEKKNRDIQERIRVLDREWQAKEIKKMAVERLKGDTKESSKDKPSSLLSGLPEPKEEEEIERAEESPVLDENAKRITEEILNVLDVAWARKLYPNRVYLLEKIEEIDAGR